jgi:hypothetical protein
MNKFLSSTSIEEIESFYGKGSKITVKNLVHSITNDCILIEATIQLGEEISEDVLHNELCDILLRETIEPIFPKTHIKTLISWES